MRHNLSVKKWITLSTLGILLSFACAKSAEAKPGDAYSADKAAKYADSCFKKSGSTYVINPNPKYGEELCAGYFHFGVFHTVCQNMLLLPHWTCRY